MTNRRKPAIPMIKSRTLAPYPFDDPRADIILRSSDKQPVYFRTFRLLLSLASPFFSLLFTLPQPSIAYHDDEIADGLPVVPMAEDKRTLQFLLGLCYPISVHEPLPLSSLSDFQMVTEAAVKFEMEGVQKHLRQEIVAPRFIESQPLRVFAIALRYGWETQGREAARYTLRHSLSAPFVAELEYISAAAYHRLQEYHWTCGQVGSSRVLVHIMNADPDDGWVWFTCQACPRARDDNSDGTWWTSIWKPKPRKWWVDWIRGVAEEVQKLPWGETAKKYDLINQAVKETECCPTCAKRALKDLEGYSQILSVDIEKAVSMVGAHMDSVTIT